MNMLSWENEVQRQRDMLRKAQANALREVALVANRQRRKARILQLYRGLFTWLRKRLHTRYNENLETTRRRHSAAHADPPLR